MGAWLVHVFAVVYSWKLSAPQHLTGDALSIIVDGFADVSGKLGIRLDWNASGNIRFSIYVTALDNQ